MDLFAVKIDDGLDNWLYRFGLTLIDRNKRERLLKFINSDDLKRGLIADLLIRKIIMDRFSVENKDICFSFNRFGKPLFTSFEEFNFNLSHSGSWVVCGVDKNKIGVDVEEVKSIDFNISDLFFSEREKEYLAARMDYDTFYSIWSLKESYIKMLGEGLSHPLNNFSIVLNSYRIHIQKGDYCIRDVYFKQYSFDNRYKISLCSKQYEMPENPVILTTKQVFEAFK